MKGFTVIETIIVLLILSILGLLWALPFISFPAEVARIESVRDAVQKVLPGKAEDIMGQALDINKTIAVKQTYNKFWWADRFIPDGWDYIKKIDVSR